VKDYILGVTNGGKAVLILVNSTDWTMVIKEEINLQIGSCKNVAFDGYGRIAVVVNYSGKFMVLEIGRN
jgi:hypothetical protein